MAARKRRTGDDVLTSVELLRDLNPHPIERQIPASKVLGDLLNTVKNALIGVTGVEMPLDVRVEACPNSCAREFAPRALDDLDVLLRNTPSPARKLRVFIRRG